MTALVPFRAATRGRRRWAGALLAVVLCATSLPVYGASAAAAPGSSSYREPAAAGPPALALPTGATFVARLFWDGHDTANATSPTGAIATSFGSVDFLDYQWHARGGKLGQPIPYNVTTARVAVIYLGVPVFGRTATNPHSTPASAGFLNVSWDATADYYLLEGLYRVEAKLIVSNGTTVWSTAFYIRAQGPQSVAILPVGLGVLIAIELYALATLPRRARGPPPSSVSRSPPPAPPSSGADHSEGG